MRQTNKELWMALIAIAFITLIYLLVIGLVGGIPAASDFYGHSIGILGFLLMLMTETLYSVRKRSRSARWGKMSSWLQFHIFTGLVGPYMVLLHTSWKFNGLAGIVFLLTVLIVLSGVVGRYIYTAVPRTADGIEMEADQLEAQIADIEGDLARWDSGHPELMRAIPSNSKESASSIGSPSSAIWGRAFAEGRYRLLWWNEKRRLDAQFRGQAQNRNRLVKQRRVLQRQIASLAMARRLLSLWHSIHIPIGLALFSLAFVHMIAAVYYATLLR